MRLSMLTGLTLAASVVRGYFAWPRHHKASAVIAVNRK